MMRGPKKTALAVRNPQGEIVVEEFETKGANRPRFCKWPLIRGIFGYIDSMTVGYKALMRSAEIAGLEDMVEESPKKKKDASGEKEKRKKQEKKESKDGEEKIPAWLMTLVTVGGTVLGFAIAIVLFVFLPAWIFELVAGKWTALTDNTPALNSLWKSVFEGVTKIILLVGYMGAISLMKDIRRTFMYHGAEHKTIFCYEAGLDLTVENVRKMRRFHPRCGTSFLILMLLVSIFISFFIDPIAISVTGSVLPLLWRTVLKLLLIPLVVGVGYELIKFAGRHDNLLTKIISTPGMWLQRITVFEPTDDMIECAIKAVTEVIPDDGSDNW